MSWYQAAEEGLRQAALHDAKNRIWELRQVAMRMAEIERVVDRWMADQVADAVAIRSIVSIVEGKDE